MVCMHRSRERARVAGREVEGGMGRGEREASREEEGERDEERWEEGQSRRDTEGENIYEKRGEEGRRTGGTEVGRGMSREGQGGSERQGGRMDRKRHSVMSRLLQLCSLILHHYGDGFSQGKGMNN